MSVRKDAWVTHGVLSFSLLTLVATWAFLLVREDRGSLFPIGSVIAFIAVALAIVHTILATGAVAAWGRRPLAVFGIHLACLAVTAMFVATCFLR